jgi:prepilin-type N-terminal cleavage/methylation domain-containing protein
MMKTTRANLGDETRAQRNSSGAPSTLDRNLHLDPLLPGLRLRERLRLRGKAFTLIEIMVVVGIMGILLAIGVPSILRVLKKEGMRKSVSDVVEVCSNARARAILGGKQTEVIFHPLEKRFAVSGAGGGNRDGAQGGPPDNSGLSGQLPDGIFIEMLDINLLEYRESETARVRFFPDGTSDEMTLILHSPQRNDWRKITVEVSTGLVTVAPLKR